MMMFVGWVSPSWVSIQRGLHDGGQFCGGEKHSRVAAIQHTGPSCQSVDQLQFFTSALLLLRRVRKHLVRRWRVSRGTTGWCRVTRFSGCSSTTETSWYDWVAVDRRGSTSTCCRSARQRHPSTSSFNTRRRFVFSHIACPFPTLWSPSPKPALVAQWANTLSCRQRAWLASSAAWVRLPLLPACKVTFLSACWD